MAFSGPVDTSSTFRNGFLHECFPWHCSPNRPVDDGFLHQLRTVIDGVKESKYLLSELEVGLRIAEDAIVRQAFLENYSSSSEMESTMAELKDFRTTVLQAATVLKSEIGYDAQVDARRRRMIRLCDRMISCKRRRSHQVSVNNSIMWSCYVYYAGKSFIYKMSYRHIHHVF